MLIQTGRHNAENTQRLICYVCYLNVESRPRSVPTQYLVWLLKLTALNCPLWRFTMILIPRWDESNAVSTYALVYSEAEDKSVDFDSAAVGSEN